MGDLDASSNGDNSAFQEFKPSYVLIAIDTHESMFIKNEDDETPFSLALKACYSLADSLLLVKNKKSFSQFAVVLADEDSKASFLDFQSNLLDSVKFLKEKNKLLPETLKETYLRKGTFDLAAFFLFCKKKFVSISSAFYRRIIIYITTDDDPVSGDPQKRFTAINEANSFKSNSITFQIITTRHDFKYETFYGEMFSVLDQELVEEIAEDEEGLFEKLSSMIHTKYTHKDLNFFPMKDDQKICLPIIKKDLIKAQKLYNNARISREGKLVNRQVKGGTNPSNKFSLKSFSEVTLSIEEKNEVKHSDFPIGLTLLCMSKRITEVGEIRRKSSLIEYNGKKKDAPTELSEAFSKFWRRCYREDKVLICAHKMRYQGKVRFVELIPRFAFDKELFLMKDITYQGERRGLPRKDEDEEDAIAFSASEEQEAVTKALVDKLTFDYDPRMFHDPSFAKKRAYLKAKLLNEPMEEVYDNTVDVEKMNAQIGDIAEKFKNLFALNVEANKKRKGGASAGARSKKAK